MDATKIDSIASLTLCEFLRKVACIDEDKFCLETFKCLVERLDLPDKLLNEHIFFDDKTYARNLICLTPRFEVLVMCWKPGQLSVVHDHLDSFATIRVFRGTLYNEFYRRVDDGSKEGYAKLEPTTERLDGAGAWVNMDLEGVHKMGNRADATEDLVTLHFYAKPLREINVFDVENESVERVRLIYSPLHF